VSALTCMRVQCTLIGCCYKLTSSGRNNRREQSLLVQQPSRVGKLLWSSVVLLLSGRCSFQTKRRTHVLLGGTARTPSPLDLLIQVVIFCGLCVVVRPRSVRSACWAQCIVRVLLCLKSCLIACASWCGTLIMMCDCHLRPAFTSLAC
jgi:hypothetical protein